MDAPKNVLMSELYFLLQKFLSTSPLQETYKAFSEEIKQNSLLPMRLDWTGQAHELTFEELERLYKHIQPDHIFQICAKLGSLVENACPQNTRSRISFLGVGNHSLIRNSQQSLVKKPLQFYAARKHGTPCHFISNVKLHNIVQNIIGQETGGPMYRRFIVTPRLYSCQQLQRETLGHLSAVYCLLFDHTGRYIVTGADDLLVKLWSAYTGRLLFTFRGASAEITDIDINLENTLLAAGSIDKILRVWDLQTGVPVAVLTAHTGMITSVNFCPSTRWYAQYLITTSTDGSVAFWSYNQDAKHKYNFMPKPILYQEKIRPGQAQMICSSFSPGGAFLATGSADHHVRVYGMHGDEGPQRILEIEAHTDCVDSISWAHRGLRFISGSKDGTAKVWHFECQHWKSIELSMSTKLSIDPPAAEANKKLKVTMVAWDCSDSIIITADSECKLKVWDALEGKLRKELTMHTEEIYVLESHPLDSNLILSAGHDGQLIIWDLNSGQPVTRFTNNIEGQGYGAVFDAKWSPDGTMIAASDSHGHILMFGFGTGDSKLKELPRELFFHTDYRPLVQDGSHWVLDEQTQVPPHLMPPPFLVDIDGNPYPPMLQKLVPGRENCKTEQLVPNIVVGNEGTQEVIEGLPNEQPRSDIDRMIQALAQRQYGQDNANMNESDASGQPSTRNAPRNGIRRSGDEGVRQSSGDWQRDPNIKWKKNVLVQPLNHAQLNHAQKVIDYHNTLEVTEYKNEMKRRLTMINTATTSTTHNKEKRAKKTRIRTETTYQDLDAEISCPSMFDDSADEDIVLSLPSNSESSESSGYSDWNTDRGTLQPPKRSKRKQINKQQYVNNSEPDELEETEEKVVKVKAKLAKCEKDVPEIYKPLDWLSETMPRKAPYYPQMGDEVIYFRQGHKLYIDAVTSKKLYEISPKDIPWSKGTIKDQEFVKVVGIKYELRPPRLCCLKLAILDAEGKLTGNVFTVKYHDMADVLDFFVLKQLFDTAVSRCWNPEDKFRCVIDDCWWIGEIVSKSPVSEEYPDSLFMCYEIRWDNGEFERMSPWDLEPINEERLPNNLGEAVPVLPEEMAGMLYQPYPEEWPRGDRAAACATIISNLDKVMELAIAEPFLTPVDLSQYPTYAFIIEYPIDLSTIKTRFENHFYRRITAAQFDVRYLATNAEKFNELHSVIVKHARIITDLCLRIIRGTSEGMDVTTLYHQLVDAYESSDNEMEVDVMTPGPSVSRNLRPLRTRNFQCPDDWKHEAQELLDALWHNEDSFPFRTPVDHVRHPDYYQVIENPIDLGKIKEDLQMDTYKTPFEFSKDVRLLFQNSKNYNTNKRSRIYTMTVRLSAMFEEHITSITQNWKVAKRRTINARPRRNNMRSTRQIDSSTKSESDSDVSYEEVQATSSRYKRSRRQTSSSSESSVESSSSSSSDSSNSSDNKPLQRSAYVNGHKKVESGSQSSDSENDSDYQPLSALKKKPVKNSNERQIEYETSESEEEEIQKRTRNAKRPRTVIDSSDSDSVHENSRKSRNSLVTVSSRGRVRKLTAKVRAFLEK